MSHKLPQPVTRRHALCRIGNGFGMLAFASLVGESLATAGVLEASALDGRPAALGSISASSTIPRAPSA